MVRTGYTRNAYIILIEKSLEKYLLGRPKEMESKH
jgi:hypothetical protein